jgi:hypothetical protein
LRLEGLSQSIYPMTPPGIDSWSLILSSPPISYTHSSLPHSCYMPCPSHPPWLDRSNYVWRGVQVMKLLIMQFPPICIKNKIFLESCRFKRETKFVNKLRTLRTLQGFLSCVVHLHGPASYCANTRCISPWMSPNHISRYSRRWGLHWARPWIISR